MTILTLSRTMMLLCLAGLLVTAPAFADGIDTINNKLRRNEELSKRYEEAALRFHANGPINNNDKTLDVRAHTCSILADLLDIGSESLTVWTFPDPGLDSKDFYQISHYAISLKNYIATARELLGENDFSWRYRWNLNCHSNYGSPKWYEFEEGPEFNLILSSDRSSIHVIGGIRPGLYDALAKRLVIHRSIKRIELSSGGGLAEEGIKIGTLLRQRKLSTVVRNGCNSACTLVFIGGVERIVPAPHYDLGFHRASENGRAVSDGDFIYDDIRKYADKMIRRGEDIVHLSQSGTGSDYYRPSATELCDFGIATWVENVCGQPPGQ